MDVRQIRQQGALPLHQGEQSARARLADISMASVTWLAPEAITPGRSLGKMKELLHWR